MIASFVIGAAAGGLAVWFWRDRIQQSVKDAADGSRARVAQGLENVQRSAEGAIESTRERISSGLRAGQEYLRADDDRERSGSSRAHG